MRQRFLDWSQRPRRRLTPDGINDHVLWPKRTVKLKDTSCGLTCRKMSPVRLTCSRHATHTWMNERILFRLSTEIYGRDWPGDQLHNDATTTPTHEQTDQFINPSSYPVFHVSPKVFYGSLDITYPKNKKEVSFLKLRNLIHHIPNFKIRY